MLQGEKVRLSDLLSKYPVEAESRSVPDLKTRRLDPSKGNNLLDRCSRYIRNRVPSTEDNEGPIDPTQFVTPTSTAFLSLNSALEQGVLSEDENEYNEPEDQNKTYASILPEANNLSTDFLDLSSSTSIMANAQEEQGVANLNLGGRTPILAPIVIKTLTTGFAPYRSLILTSLDHPRYKTPAMAYDKRMILGGLLFCQWRLEALQVYNNVRHNVLLIGELIAPFLPDTCYMSPGQALDHSRNILKHVIPGEVAATCPGLTAIVYAGLPAVDGITANRYGLPDTYPYSAAVIDTMSADQIIRFLDLAGLKTEDADDERIGLSLLTNFIVAVCKQGTISSDFQEKNQDCYTVRSRQGS